MWPNSSNSHSRTTKTRNSPPQLPAYLIGIDSAMMSSASLSHSAAISRLMTRSSWSVTAGVSPKQCAA
jgi:hypothetical protein